MTEADAKTKWCPSTRITGATESHHAMDNRGDLIDPMRVAGLCIASECMAWRWKTETYTPSGGDPLATRKPVRNTIEGFCGLAGAPQ